MELRVIKKSYLNLAIPILLLLLIGTLNVYSSKASMEGARSTLKEATKEKIPTSDYFDVYFRSTPVATVDNYSECIELGHILSTSKLSFGSRPGVDAPDSSPCEIFPRNLNIQDDSIFYGRFFHGTAALLRVVLDLASYHQIQIGTTLLLVLTLVFINILISRKHKVEAIACSIVLFGLTDFPFQGLSLTHGISTLVGLNGLLLLRKVSKKPKSVFILTAIICGFSYCYFAQLYTPIAFALLGVLILALSTDEFTETLGNYFFCGWMFGYLSGVGLRFLQGVHQLGLGTMINEDSGGVTNRLTSSVPALVRVTYMHLILNPSKYPLKIASLIALGFMFGFAVSQVVFKTKSYAFKLPKLPLLLTGIWYLALGGHDGHGWVANLLFIVLLYILIGIGSWRMRNVPESQSTTKDSFNRSESV